MSLLLLMTLANMKPKKELRKKCCPYETAFRFGMFNRSLFCTVRILIFIA